MLTRIALIAAAAVVSLWPADRAASAETTYQPIQNISYATGSKSMSGYFVQRNSVCVVTMMIAEKIDPDLPQMTAARVRVMLDPGQVVGLDSEEGKSINLTCGEDAATLTVSYGDRSDLIAQQSIAIINTVGERVVQRASFRPRE